MATYDERDLPIKDSEKRKVLRLLNSSFSQVNWEKEIGDSEGILAIYARALGVLERRFHFLMQERDGAWASNFKSYASDEGHRLFSLSEFLREFKKAESLAKRLKISEIEAYQIVMKEAIAKEDR